MAIKRTSKKNRFRKKNSNNHKENNRIFPRKDRLLKLVQQRKFAPLLAHLTLYFITITTGWVLLLRFVNPPFTWLMVQRGLERKIDGKDWKLQKHWLRYEDISDNLKKAAIAGEDAHFMVHGGFDIKAIRDAYKRNQDGKNIRGGSTISQQTAKNVFLWPGRSWIRKGFETYFTILIELLWGKKRILEVYLNVIETGDGLYGADTATTTYFKKTATSLSKRQAALLIAVLPNPIRWSPAKPTAYINRKASSIIRYMEHSKIPD